MFGCCSRKDESSPYLCVDRPGQKPGQGPGSGSSTPAAVPACDVMAIHNRSAHNSTYGQWFPKRIQNLNLSQTQYEHAGRKFLNEESIKKGVRTPMVLDSEAEVLGRLLWRVHLAAIIECADAAHGLGGFIIGDGGITCPGDMSKAFGGGADFVMMGGQFAGHDENPGEVIEENGKKMKLFYGMSSEHAMNKHYGQMAKYRSSEGREIKIPYKGPLENTILDYLGGVRSTCTYINAKCIKHIPKCTTFILASQQLNTHFV